MEIKIQFKGKVYSISFGRETKWFSSRYFITIIQEFVENRETTYAKMIVGWFPQ